MSTAAGLAFVVLAAVRGGLYWLVRWNRGIEARGHAQRGQRPAMLGWDYDDTPQGDIAFVVRGRTGEIKWELACDSDRSSEESKPSVGGGEQWNGASDDGNVLEGKPAGNGVGRPCDRADRRPVLFRRTGAGHPAGRRSGGSRSGRKRLSGRWKRDGGTLRDAGRRGRHAVTKRRTVGGGHPLLDRNAPETGR